MPVVKFTGQTMPPSGEALKQELRKALDNASPLDDFIQVIKDLTQFELRYKLDSAEFFTRFQQGQMGDDIDFMRWATRYEIHREMKAGMEQLFNALDQYALPVAV